jgi:DNA repair ATPase RecN
MKNRFRSLTLFAICLLATTTFLSGCAKTGMQRSVKASNSIEQVDSEMRKMVTQIDTTAASLDAVVSPGQPDLKKAFNTYSDNVADLEKTGDKVLKYMAEMKVNTKEYFTEWSKEGDAYTNPRLRELSQERQNKLADIYAQVPAANEGVKESYQAYITDLKEIQMYLSNDLTPNGIASVTPITQKSVRDLDRLKASIRPVIYALDEIKAELYSGK